MAPTWWDTRSIPRKRSKLKSGEVEVVGPVHGVCVAVLSVCVACPVCPIPSFPHHESLLIGVIRSLSLSISPSRSLDRLLGPIYLSLLRCPLVHPGTHPSPGKKKMRNKRAGADGELWDAREIAFLPSSLPSGLEWRGRRLRKRVCVIKCCRMRISWRGGGDDPPFRERDRAWNAVEGRHCAVIQNIRTQTSCRLRQCVPWIFSPN